LLTGKKFHLKQDTISIETLGDSRSVVMVPSGEVVTVLHGPSPDDKRMVDVRWDDRTLVMFAEDIQRRGEEVTEQTA